MARTDGTGETAPRRWEAFEPILESGIDILTTLDIWQIASLEPLARQLDHATDDARHGSRFALIAQFDQSTQSGGIQLAEPLFC